MPKTKLTISFRKWKKRRKEKSMIIKLFQGDDNLILEMSKAKEYFIKVFKHLGRGNFKLIEEKNYRYKINADQYYNKVVREF